MDRLVGIVQELSKAKTLSAIIDIVRVAARQATGADGAAFVLRDNGFCHYVDEDAIGPLWKGKKFPLSACISGWSMLHQESVIIPDIFKDPRIPIEAYASTFVKSVAVAPIRISDPIGAIGTYWAKPHTATEEEMAVLQAIAETTAVALENVQLYSSLQDRVHELEKSNKAKDDFLMMISHELRTPLNSILGWSEELVGEDIDAELQKEALSTISRNAHAQGRVIDSLLDASSIVLNRFSIVEEEIDLKPLVEKIFSALRPEAEKKKIDFSLKILMDEAPVTGDPQRLKQAIHHLIDNAIKFTPSGGKVLAEVFEEGPSLIFKVKDNGKGLSKEEQQRIFSRFSQPEDYLTRHHGGLGLGLAVSREIAEAHHGELIVKSEGKGQGAEFFLSLPKSWAKTGLLQQDQFPLAFEEGLRHP